MGWVTVIMVYAVMWWLAFFVVLPFGQVSQDEAGEVVPGTVSSAPVGLNWKKKIAITSVLAMAITGVIYTIVTWDVFGFTP